MNKKDWLVEIKSNYPRELEIKAKTKQEAEREARQKLEDIIERRMPEFSIGRTTRSGDSKGFIWREYRNEIKVKSKKLPDEQMENYAIARRLVEIKGDDNIVWKGIITDIGALSYGGFEDGTTKPEGDYEKFSTPKELAENFNLELSDLVFGKDNEGNKND